MNSAIKVENLSKDFWMDIDKAQSIFGKLIGFLKSEKNQVLVHALKNVSFEVEKGEVIGLIGRNGSGKTTLLRVLSGIYKNYEGGVEVEGKVRPISGFNCGLNPRLTLRENVSYIGSLLGIPKAEAEEKFADIVEFSGLQDYVDTKVFQFSSGMIARLAFSITYYFLEYSKPDVLLLDEVFSSGGDEDFRKKGLEKVKELISGGTTVVIAGHDMDVIQENCERVIWLEKGEVMDVGVPKTIIEKYLKNFKK